MKRKRGWLLYPLIILAMVLCAAPAFAAVPMDLPSIPHAFYGTVTIGGSDAPVGTVVTAKVGGVQCGSITTTVAGQYGGSGAFDAKLTVTGEIATGATISFFVSGVDTTQTYAFSPGGVTELNLTAEAPSDTTAPSVTITALTPDPTTDNTPTLTGTATDTASNIAGVEYKVDAGSWAAATASDGAFDNLSEGYTFTTAALADGAHTVYVRATDAASTPNTTAEADYASDGFTVDTGAPSVVVTALTPDPASDNTPTLTGTATDTLSNIAGVEYKVDAGSWAAATASDGAFDSLSEGYTFTTAALADGAHTVYVRATDAATNTTAEADYASDAFTLDATAPTVSSKSPAADATGVAVDVAVTATFGEDVLEGALGDITIITGTTEVTGVSATLSANTITIAHDAFDLGTSYTVTIPAEAVEDSAGNLSAEITWSFTTVTVTPGDATGDGVVDARDITKVERIIAGLDAQTPGADANQDGNINALDITKVERIIAGLD